MINGHWGKSGFHTIFKSQTDHLAFCVEAVNLKELEKSYEGQSLRTDKPPINVE